MCVCVSMQRNSHVCLGGLRGAVQTFLYRLMGFLVFLGQCFCKRTSRALPPASLLKRDVNYFFPVIACPYSFSFHFSVIWLITSLSGLREVICCTSLPGWLPSQAAVSSNSSISPSQVCSPSPAPPQPFPCGNTCLSQTCSRDAGGICAGLGAPRAGATQGRQRGRRGKRRERRGSFPGRRRSVPEGTGSRRLFGHIKQSSCVGFHMSGVPGSMTYGLI